MSTSILFEHPLNEKMRTWLRIEFLNQQLQDSSIIHDHLTALTFFRNLSELLDVFDRGELRTDILKSLSRQQQKLKAWREIDGADQSRIDSLTEQLSHCASQLMAAPRPGQSLREDKLISTVMHRLNIPGGCCCFDLPTLHFWLHLPQEVRDIQVKKWLSPLEPLRNALVLLLDFTRQSAVFHEQTSINGFFQDNAEGADLLRLQLALDDAIYPQVSGHKSRYAIRFLPLEHEGGEVPSHFNFQLACC